MRALADEECAGAANRLWVEEAVLHEGDAALDVAQLARPTLREHLFGVILDDEVKFREILGAEMRCQSRNEVIKDHSRCEEGKAYASQSHGDVATAASNVNYGAVDVAPRKTVSQFGDLTIHCQKLRDWPTSVGSPILHTSSNPGHCLCETRRKLGVLLIVREHWHTEVGVEGRVCAIGVVGRCFDAI